MKAMATMQAAPAKSLAVPVAPAMTPVHQARGTRPDARAMAGHDLGRLQLRSAHERARGDGRVLPSPLRLSLESQFRAPLDHVRVHDTPDAHREARRHRANAFTIGSDIYFGKRRYRPSQRDGRALVAHEIAHVLQHAIMHGQVGSLAALEHEATALGARSVSQAVLPAVAHRLPAATVRPVLRSAATLKQAIEDELDDVFVGIDNVWPMIRNESQAARDIVRRDGALERYIRSEVSDPMELLKTYLLLAYQRESRFPVHFRDFIEATDMVGTHEARIYAIFRGVTQAEREEMAAMPGLVEVVEDEMSGDELRRAWALLYGRVEHTGADVSPARSSTHLEESERYELAVEVRGSFDTVEKNMTAAAQGRRDEVPRDVLLQDSSLWAKVADEFNLQETWYFRMIARYGGRNGFPTLVGPTAPARSFLFPIWEAVEGGGTDEDKLYDTFTAATRNPGVAAPEPGAIPGGLRATASQELQSDPWFLPMLEDELTAAENAHALTILGASATAAPAAEASLKEAIDDQDMAEIRKVLTDPGLSVADRTRLQNDPEILEEMGDELSGVQLCKTSLLLKYGSAPFPPNVRDLIARFERNPIDATGAITFLRGLSGTAGALGALRDEPGLFFMLTNSGLPAAQVHTLVAALRADQADYQEPGSEGAYRHHTETTRALLPVHFTAAEVRLPIRCSIDKSRMREPNEFDTDLIEDWVRAIDDVWNGKFVLVSGSTTLNLVFAPYIAVGLANPDVRLFVMDWKDRSFVRSEWDPARRIWLDRQMHLYLDGLESGTVAHEFGHILGNPDEYNLTASEYVRITGTPGESPTPEGGQDVKGLMGSHYDSRDVSARHAWPALAVINNVRDVARYPAAFMLRRR